MFEITLNDKTLYHPASVDCNITNAVIHEALNDAGYMEITIPFGNPVYDELEERKGKIIVYKDNVEMWYGEVRDISVDFSKNKSIYVVGEASYLNDTVQPQRKIKGTKFQILQEFLNTHNSMCGPGKEFQIGAIGDDSRVREIVVDWEYTLDAIRNHLCDDEQYFRIRHVNGIRYIDIMPLESYGKRSDQTIMFGDNLLDYAEESSGEKIATICIPLGATLEEGGIENHENYLTCEKANGGKNYVELPGAINRLGRITKVVHFNVLTDPSALVTAALNYLQDSQYAKLSLKLSAVDLSILQADIDNYAVGDYVRAICEPMGMDSWLPVRERETDLLNLANNQISVGAERTKSITSQNAEMIGEIEQKIPSKDSILNAAKKNASALINGAGDNGHVVFHTNAQGVVYEILIMDTPDIRTAKKIWRWNENGFGYSKDGGKEYGLAMTMDGQIVADFITSGTMQANRIQGGTLTVGGNDNKNGSIQVNDASNKTIVAINNKGIDIDKGTINIGTSFEVNSDGKLTATNADIKGAVNATSGNISGELFVGGSGNSTSNGGSIAVKDTNDNVVVKLNSNGIDIDKGSIDIGGKFKVGTDGTLTATGADITGAVKATSGYIGDKDSGWQIGSSDIHNGCAGINDTTSGMYIGTDGFRNQYGFSFTRIVNGTLVSNTGITGKNLIATEDVSGSTITGDSFRAQKTEGIYTGIDYEIVVKDSDDNYVGLVFKNGLLVATS